MSLDRVGQWSIDKLDILAEYAVRYSQVMNGQKKEWLRAYYYIDAFAGPGIALHKDDELVSNFLKGSPVRVADIEPPFDHLWLIDRKAARDSLLRNTLEGGRILRSRYSVQTGEANELIRSRIQRLDSRDRALVFLDPYGLQIEWRTIEALAASNKVDLLINFH
jgi:three-Cys-motif partner protein